MNFKKSISKKSLLRRISGIALTLVMVINLMYGYSAAKAQVTEEARKASQVAAQKAEANKAPYRNVMYYGDWSIYSGQKNFTPDKIDGSLITHLNFAFMDADENGDLITTDTWADYENPNVGYSVGTDNKYAGVLGGMLLLRQKYPNMKIGISVGGWTRSGDFPKLAASEKTRKNFGSGPIQDCSSMTWRPGPANASGKTRWTRMHYPAISSPPCLKTAKKVSGSVSTRTE